MSIQTKTNKTAVQVIIDFINENGVFKKSNPLLVSSFDDLLTQVSLLEKKQIKDAVNHGLWNNEVVDLENYSEIYYSQTFKND